MILWGYALIKPTAANTPTAQTITFAESFSDYPYVFTTERTSVPGTTVLGSGATNITQESADIYASRTNTTTTEIDWLAIGLK